MAVCMHAYLMSVMRTLYIGFSNVNRTGERVRSGVSLVFGSAKARWSLAGIQGRKMFRSTVRAGMSVITTPLNHRTCTSFLQETIQPRYQPLLTSDQQTVRA